MKFKKRSTQKRSTQKRQRQRQRLLKRCLRNSILQHGGKFMDMMIPLKTEGHSYTSMSVHSNKQLIVIGNNAGELILWKINTESPPKKLAVLNGLPRAAVKFTEFHKTLPIIAAGFSDKVLMWRYQEEEDQEDVQQLQPSHTVFSLKSKDDLEREFSEMKTNLKQMEKIRQNLYSEQDTLRVNQRVMNNKIEELDYEIKQKRQMQFLEKLKQDLQEEVKQINSIRERIKEIEAEITSKNRDIKKIPNALETLEIEINNLKQNLQNEVSCIAFHPDKPYIAVGLNNKTTNVSSRFVMYTFDAESIEALYDIIPDNYSPRNEVNVLMASFSSDGDMFAYTTCRFNDRGVCDVLKVQSVLRVQNFYTDNQELETSEKKVYEIPNRSVTCITPYKSIRGFHDGSRYSSHGIMMTHEFLIGCDDGSLRLIDVITVQPSRKDATIRIEEFISVKEWNSGRDKIICLAIHPSLPLFASGSRDAAKLWEFEKKSNEELKTLPLQDVISVGFNDKFLAVCGSSDVRVYSCNPGDYGSLKQEKLKRKEILDNLHNELREKTLKGQCSICFGPMTSQTEPSITSGPEEVIEKYLPCKHKFHQKCIAEWLKQGNTCPECRAKDGLPQSTPAGVVTQRRGELAELARRALFTGPASPASPASPAYPAYPGSVAPESTVLTQEQLRAARIAYIENRRNEQQQQQQQPSENSGGGIKNKYSRKKYSSKKSKIRHRYSKKK